MTTYEVTAQMAAQLGRSFQYHAPTPDQVERYPLIREKARELADLIVQLSPPSREQSLAITHVEEAVMWANAGIVRNEQR